ncbi:MAG TPA: hypothetical protein VHK28_08480 [Candidatus Limnocylindria bacterium]|nr:hypothetical protein [Candidatus Limnocylindria bacterium]
MSRWLDWAGYAAAAWSAIYTVLNVYWWLGGAGFPFGPENDTGAELTILADARAASVAPIITVIGGAGALVGLAMSRSWRRGAVRAWLIGFGVTAAVILALLIPDYRVLTVIAYTLVIVFGLPFGWPPEADLLGVLTGPILNQFWCIVGGLLWAGATLAYWRRGRGACASCGRTDAAAGWSSPQHAPRWGRSATYVAVAIPVAYAATRWAWALGIPLGISEDFLRKGQEVGLWFIGAALATLAVAGALLTLGLTQRWGEVFPSWLPVIGGRNVPPMLAVVPAMLVAVVVTSAGLMFWRVTLRGEFPLGGLASLNLENAWAALLPELLWPLWGAALATAAIAYYLRRRGHCARCGRG